MKLAHLKKVADPAAPAEGRMRGTEAQDSARPPPQGAWSRYGVLLIAGGTGFALLLVYLVHGWLGTAQVISRERLRFATVSRGHFVRDVAADGTVVAAVSPTLFAIAPGTVSYVVRAGDAVRKGQLLAQLDSPELRNEYQRERATLDSLDAALARQQIEIRRQILTSKQQADLAQVAIQAAQRELARNQWAWDEHAIPERDYKRAQDDVATAQLNYDHARQTAALERESLALDLRTKHLERDRQALVVAGLASRVAALEVRSPVDGTVGNLAVAEKTHVPADAALVTVVDLSAFEIEFQVAESYATEIKPGMAAQVTLEGAPVAGTVTAISPEVRASQVTGRLQFKGAQPPRLRQNERAAVRIVLDEREQVLKFERGSFIEPTTRSVYVVHGTQAVQVPVQL
ncbi:MAG TPA: efflux RND transporter periplasmic adaptor subunit, partial [Steroidobacteraceae bacterium]|nr:efflux RND transporter periplasmic adaptor subunit [Steroidobacteraceae bacterium]